MILFILPNISGRAWVHAGTERMLACRTQISGWDIRRYCFWWGVWWDSTQLDANVLGRVWLGSNHTNCYMLDMHLRYYKGRNIQQTPGAISRFTSWGNPDEPEVHTQKTHPTPFWARGHSQLWMPNLRQEDLSKRKRSNKLLSRYLMHRTRTQDEWWNQNHFGSWLSCNWLESVYFFQITWGNSGLKIQPHCHRKPQTN